MINVGELLGLKQVEHHEWDYVKGSDHPFSSVWEYQGIHPKPAAIGILEGDASRYPRIVLEEVRMMQHRLIKDYIREHQEEISNIVNGEATDKARQAFREGDLYGELIKADHKHNHDDPQSHVTILFGDRQQIQLEHNGTYHCLEIALPDRHINERTKEFLQYVIGGN